MIPVELLVPSFIAGLLTFLAPCTLPLVPGYLGFISGVTASELQQPQQKGLARRKIMINSILYTAGFSLVFIFLGSLFGLGGVAFARYRVLFSRIGGVFVMLFGLYMIKPVLFRKLSFLSTEKQFDPTSFVQPGHAISSFIFGATFAFGWTPCIGPILGSVLILASSSTTVGQGAFLLFVFSLGLATPFLLIAAMYGSATRYVSILTKYSGKISMVGGIFLVLIGFLLMTNSYSHWGAFFLRYINLEPYLLKFL